MGKIKNRKFMRVFKSLFLLVLMSLYSCSLEKDYEMPEVITESSNVSINVNTNSIIASNVSNKYGINLNAAADHDNNRAVGARKLSSALLDMGVKHLRFPGGLKTCYYAWTLDPLNPNPATHYWTGWVKEAAARAPYDLNFDEFMKLCADTGAEPHINVAYNKANATLQKIHDEKLAAAWVKYANITKKYGVKYWEIGNEMWNSDNWGGPVIASVQELANIVKLYSNAMKAVDPTIKVGVSWKANETQKLIDLCGPALDFVTISNYTDAGGATYNKYKYANNKNLLSVSNNLTLNTVISEFNYANWSNSEWDTANTTGKGLIAFDFVGQMLKSPKTVYGCIWNTRYFPQPNGVYPKSKFNVLDNSNNLTPIVQPFSLWGKFIKDKLVDISSDSYAVVAYAAYDDINKDLNIFLINKQTTSRNVTINISSDSKYDSGEVWQYKGVDEWDTNPTMGKVDDVAVINNTITYSLPSTSITVFKLTKKSL